VVRALPDFFAGYLRAVAEVGKADTVAGRELREIAEAMVPARDRCPEAPS
jgi:hypothetical protein